MIAIKMRPIDVNLVQKYGLPIKYGNKTEIIPGDEAINWLLNRKLRSQGMRKLSKRFISMICFESQGRN